MACKTESGRVILRVGAVPCVVRPGYRKEAANGLEAPCSRGIQSRNCPEWSRFGGSIIVLPLLSSDEAGSTSRLSCAGAVRCDGGCGAVCFSTVDAVVVVDTMSDAGLASFCRPGKDPARFFRDP